MNRLFYGLIFLQLIGTTVIVRAWTNNNASNERISEHHLQKFSFLVSIITPSTATRKAFWNQAGASLGILGGAVLVVPEGAVAKSQTYLKERGSLESGLRGCPGQPAKKCCWSTEDTQGRRIQRWEAPFEIQGNAKAIAKQLEDAMAEYPQQGQNDVDRGGWVFADKQTDNSGQATYLRYEFTSGKLKYVDELELLVDSSGNVSVRTSSRSAGFDYNVNATRLNYMQKALQKKGWTIKLV